MPSNDFDIPEARRRLKQAHTSFHKNLRDLTSQIDRLGIGDIIVYRDVNQTLKIIQQHLIEVEQDHLKFVTYHEKIFIEALDTFESRTDEDIRRQNHNYVGNFRRRVETASEKVSRSIPQARSSFAVYKNYAFQFSELLYVPEVPSQIAAPIKVVVQDNSILRLFASQTHEGPVSTRSVEALRETSRSLLERTIYQISGATNADPRLGPNLEGLLEYLSYPIGQMPIEALGLNYKFAKRSFDSSQETIPAILCEQIEQILTTTNVILQQYEEWRLYLSAEVSANLSNNDKLAAVVEAEALKDYLEENSKFVEQKLIDRLAEITNAYSTGLINIDSIAVPLMLSFGNIFSEISRFTIAYAQPDLATAGTSVLFLGFAIQIINKFFYNLSKFPPLSYLADVHDFIKKNFSFLKDSLPL